VKEAWEGEGRKSKKARHWKCHDDRVLASTLAHAGKKTFLSSDSTSLTIIYVRPVHRELIKSEIHRRGPIPGGLGRNKT
jgi:hypothetical protein